MASGTAGHTQGWMNTRQSSIPVRRWNPRAWRGSPFGWLQAAEGLSQPGGELASSPAGRLVRRFSAARAKKGDNGLPIDERSGRGR
jgi:hypothetical protein